MFKIILTDRELRELARIFTTRLAGSGLESPFDDKAMETLAAKVDSVVDENIDALERIDAAESGES